MNLLQRATRLLTPFMDEERRDTWLADAFWSEHRGVYDAISRSGATADFTVRCVRFLLDRGCLGSRHALSVLLDVVRSDVGDEQQTAFQTLIDELDRTCVAGANPGSGSEAHVHTNGGRDFIQCQYVVSPLDDKLPHHRLELTTYENEDGLLIGLNNPGNSALEDCRVVLRKLSKWSIRDEEFIPQQLLQPMVLLSCDSVRANGSSDRAFLVMLNKAGKAELLVHETVQGGRMKFLKEEAVWRFELVVEAKQKRAFHTLVYVEWTPGLSPRVTPEPKAAGAARRSNH
jgi:hypothetical protein